MKLFISADIEGTCGVCSWDETMDGRYGYDFFSRQMTKEVNAVCKAALDSGKVDQILIKDAHDKARNLQPDMLPQEVMLHRGWEGAPGSMMAGVDSGCDAAVMTGYHSAACTDGNPLSHTSNLDNQFVKINGRIASEFMINLYQAAYYKVPVILVTGDKALCESAKELCPNIETAAVSEGHGGASVSMHPEAALRLIREKTQAALAKDPDSCLIDLPEHFHVEIEFKEFVRAKKGSYYPGAKREGCKGVTFDTDDYYEVLRFLFFVL